MFTIIRHVTTPELLSPRSRPHLEVKALHGLLCPPSKKRGYIVLLMSVCPSVDHKVSADYLKTIYHKVFIFHIMIGHT
jgi:hypothetical protein